jgi:hypothetical protein
MMLKKTLFAGAVLAGAMLFAAPAYAQPTISFQVPGFSFYIGDGDF